MKIFLSQNPENISQNRGLNEKLKISWEKDRQKEHLAKLNSKFKSEVMKMIVVMKSQSDQQDLDEILEVIKEEGFEAHLSQGVETTIIGLIGDTAGKEQVQSRLASFSSVEKVIPILDPYKLTGWKFKPEKTVIEVGEVKIGGEKPVVMAGPCAVENEEQLMTTARAVKEAGAEVLRGGAFKPRTSPYSFQGLGEEGLKLLDQARQETGLKIITELMDLDHLELVAEYTDIIQIGARNMQNYPLLSAIGKLDKPAMLKRGMSATIREWLLAAEYIMCEGNQQVILCERGIRTFGEETRNTLDLSSVPMVNELSHLPVIVDPSHGTGRWELVNPMARAAIAVGVDGLLVEVHPNPKEALSDGPQSLKLKKFAQLMADIKMIHESLGESQGTRWPSAI